MAMACLNRPFHGSSLFPVLSLSSLSDPTGASIQLPELARGRRVLVLVLPGGPSPEQLQLVDQLHQLCHPTARDFALVLVLHGEPTGLLQLAEAFPGALLAADPSGELVQRLELVGLSGALVPGCCLLAGHNLRICCATARLHPVQTARWVLRQLWGLRRAGETAAAHMEIALSAAAEQLGQRLWRQSEQFGPILPLELLAPVLARLDRPPALVSKSWHLASQLAAVSAAQGQCNWLRRSLPRHPGLGLVVASEVPDAGQPSCYPEGTQPGDCSETELWHRVRHALAAGLRLPGEDIGCDQLRQIGNRLFVDKQLMPALLCFSTLIAALESQADPPARALATLLSNSAAVLRHMGDRQAAVWNCDKALAWCPSHSKARFQRAKLHAQEGQTKEAVKDLKLCLQELDGAPSLREEASALLISLQVGLNAQEDFEANAQHGGYGGYGGY